MSKIICSLEEWDSILDFYRPNGSSKSWYIKELKRISRPLMWGDWDIFSENGVSSVSSVSKPYQSWVVAETVVRQ